MGQAKDINKGFFAGYTGNYAEDAYNTAMRAIKAETGAEQDSVHAFLDSPLGYKFAKTLQLWERDLMPGSAAKQAARSWQHIKLTAETVRDLDLPDAKMPYLTAMVYAAAIQAGAI